MKKMKIPFFPDRWRFLVVVKNTHKKTTTHDVLQGCIDGFPSEQRKSHPMSPISHCMNSMWVFRWRKRRRAAWSSSYRHHYSTSQSSRRKKQTHTLTLLVRVHYYSRGDDAVHYAFKLYDVDVYNVWKIPLCFRRYCKI